MDSSAVSINDVPLANHQPLSPSHHPLHILPLNTSPNSLESSSPLGPHPRPTRPPHIDVPLANRFSVQTHNSTTSAFTTSTSIYPQSSYLSGTDSVASDTPSLHTPPSYQEPIGPAIHPLGSDTDDVSYRLQLLVNNSYFLPPAHHKPSNLVIPSPHTSPSKSRAQSPSGFLDLFRRSRSKSKPTTPTGISQSSDVPALRTTADSIATASGHRRDGVSSKPSLPNAGFQEKPLHRVAVVRQEFDDLRSAVQNAEQDMKNKACGDPDPPSVAPLTIIDPTDSVDVPPPGSDYPFAVQASALHAMGVGASLGADVLADRLLPASQSGFFNEARPETTLAEVEERKWRKILLQQAVSNSLDTSGASSSCEPSGLLPLLSPSTAPASPVSPPSVVGQRIIANPVIESVSPSRREPQPRTKPAFVRSTDGRSSLHHPRISSPTTPLTPLPAPPRKREPSPHRDIYLYSSDHASVGPSSVYSTATSSVRTSTSTERAEMVLTPPPISISPCSLDSIVQAGTAATESRSNSSLSRRTERSHAPSAFFDARDSFSRPPSIRPSFDSTLSPPRMSSGSRSSSFSTHRESFESRMASQVPLPRSSYSSSRAPSLNLARDSDDGQQISVASVEILEPGPSTPPLPTEEGFSSQSPAFDSSPLTPRSTQRPTAPAGSSFFDDIQFQHDAMDDLESSDEEDEQDVHVPHSPLHPPRPMYAQPNGSHSTIQSTASTSKMEPPSRLAFTRWGNHSSPNISGHDSASIGSSRRVPKDRKPVENIPKKRSFFSNSKKGSTPADQVPLSPFDFYQNAQPYPAIPMPGPGRISIGSRLSTKSTPQEGTRDLDGMLMQHMRTEKDTLKRITDKQQKSSKLSRSRR